MSSFMSAFLGAVSGALAVIILALLMPKRYCPDCQTPLPKFGVKYIRSRLWLGWICPRCGCEMDRRGRKVSCQGRERE